MKSFLCLLIAFSAITFAHAQENPKYVCDINANTAIDLGIDVVGDVLTRDGGYWDQVDPGNPSVVLAHDVSNVFVMTGLAPDTYQFVYKATNNACLNAGLTKTATVVILETPKNLTHTLKACVNETPTLDLATIVSSTLPAPVTFSAASAGTLAGSVLSIGNYTGPITVSYTVNHGVGGGACTGPATIVINVVRDDTPPTFAVDAVSFCKERTAASINLSNIAGVSAKGGSWAFAATGATVSGSVATFTGTDAPVAGVYTFTYSWPASSCYAAGTKDLVVTITDELSLPVAPTDEICKSDNPERIYDLTVEGLGLSVPATTGQWSVVSMPVEQSNPVEVADGMFRVATARAGVYKFKYTVNGLADVCGLTGNTELTITVGDVSGGAAQDGRVQLCALDVAAGTAADVLNLKSYIMNMPEAATWTGPAGVTLFGPDADQVDYTELAKLGTGTYLFSYSYNSAGCGGKLGEGNLYVTITNDLDISENITLNFCRPDMPSELNMAQVIGAELKGTWAITAGAATASVTNGVFTETNGTTGAKIYELKFTPSGTSQCTVPAEITVTIKINDNSF